MWAMYHLGARSVYSDHPDYPYKGIRNGAKLNAKGDHTSYSMINESFETIEERLVVSS
jgi:hypothetical protein